MCAYCNSGDHMFLWDPPFPTTHPLVPQPMPGVPLNPWPVERLREYRDLLREVKELEDKLGCPCPEEREKPDYLALLGERIARLEQRLGDPA